MLFRVRLLGACRRRRGCDFRLATSDLGNRLVPVEPAAPWIDSQLGEPAELLPPGGNEHRMGIAVIRR